MVISYGEVFKKINYFVEKKNFKLLYDVYNKNTNKENGVYFRRKNFEKKLTYVGLIFPKIKNCENMQIFTEKILGM